MINFTNSFKCDITAINHKVFEGNIYFINLITASGTMGILANHSPLLARLQSSTITVITDKKEELFFYVSGGFAEMSNNTMIIVADEVIRGEEIDESKVLEVKKRAETELKNLDVSDTSYRQIFIELQKANAQIRTSHLFRR